MFWEVFVIFIVTMVVFVIGVVVYLCVGVLAMLEDMDDNGDCLVYRYNEEGFYDRL